MKDVTLQKPVGFHSLSVRFALLVFLLTLGTSVAMTSIIYQFQYEDALHAEKKELTLQASNFARQLNYSLLEREKKALTANAVVSALYDAQVQPHSFPVLEDGSIRVQDSQSAAFILAKNLDARHQDLLHRSGTLWQQISPLMLDSFFNFYFITHNNFIRVAPGDWAFKIPAEHQITDELFYQSATPDVNPNRSPVWTPIYYDPLLQKWMTSLVIPVYHQQDFVGVTGTDFVLDQLYPVLASINQASVGMFALLFDEQGNLLIDGYSPKNQGEKPIFSTDYSAEKPKKEELASYITAFSQKEAAATEDLGRFLVATASVEKLGWNLTLYKEKQLVLQGLDEFKEYLIITSVMISLLVALMLQWFFYQGVLKRLNRLFEAVHVFSRGHHQLPQLDQKHDEIGLLNQTFGVMADDMNQLIVGLNARFYEKEQAEHATRKLSKAVAFSSSGLLITDKNLVLEYVNPFMLELLGCASSKLLHQPLLSLFSSEMAAIDDEIYQSLRERQHWRGDSMLEHSSRCLWVSVAIAPIRDEKGELTNYVCAMQDISFIKESQRQMEHLAYYDTLTGLANRSHFKLELKRSIALAARGIHQFALLYFDLDEFKRVNDTLGHQMGDELLKEVSQRLLERARDGDTVARLGGDEFAVILANIECRAHVAKIAQDLQQSFKEAVRLNGEELFISASIGITLAPEDAADEERLLKHADLAMYEAKARGKNTYHFFSSDLNEALQERLLLETQLREAIREQQFVLNYQAQIDSRTQQVIGYEALIRWCRPDGEVIPPARFIPVAESTGLITEIGEWVLWEACRFISRKRSKGDEVSIAVNLSVRQFADSNFVALVAQILERTGIKPEALTLEITESMLMGDTHAAIAQLNELKRLGVSLSIDDFGTGYSSLSYLKSFPVDELKIDRSFVKDIPGDTNDMDIVAAIIAMAQKMNLQVVAEGVETAEQIEFLSNNSCYLLQGFYFSKPCAEQELNQLPYQLQMVKAPA